ncbi:antitoxin family protein [Candidatus Magnetobacterium casense]|uniref:antitoxin family protein n=1 Tax=Candidatus Magnetobacterium casense TaxID=1455061 RepID=UPI00058C20EE|nr:antitoxin family protein [Candidatus Magnetobacterium casensis]
MTTIFRARVFNGVLEPLEPIDLPSEGKRVKVTIEDEVEVSHPKDTAEQPSRWARLAEEVHNDSTFAGLSEHILKSVKEFREDFAFKHDG